MEELDIVYCKDCQYFCEEIIDENSDMVYCKKKKGLDIRSPNLYCNKRCYKKRDENKNNKKKARRWKKP